MTDPRVEINEVVTVRDPISGYRLLPGASVQVNYRDAGAAPVYVDETTGATLSNPLTSDSAGRIEGWLVQDSYDFVITHPEAQSYTVRYEAVSAQGITGPTGATGPQGPGNAFLEHTLNGGITAGATTATLDRAPALATNVGFVAVDAFTSSCEIRRVTGISTATITVSPAFASNHSTGAKTVFFTGTYVPVTWFGAKGDGVTDDTAAINAALAAATTTGLLSGSANRTVYLPGGTYMISSMIEAPQSSVIVGDGADLSIIKAKSGFTFASGATAMLKSYQAVYGTPGASRRLSLHNLMLNGNNLSGANGLLASPQQPASYINLRVNSCPGYGIYLGDVQQAVMFNVEIGQCGTGMLLDGVEFMYAFGLNIEQSTVRHITMQTQSGGNACGQILFSGLHLESGPSGQPWVEVVNPVKGVQFNNVQASESGGGTIIKFTSAVSASSYQIQHMETAGAAVFVNDIFRGKSVDVATYAPTDHHLNFWDPDVLDIGALRLGGGTIQMTRLFKATKSSWNPAAVNNGDVAQTTVTCTGVVVGDIVTLSQAATSGKWIWWGTVIAADTVQINALNATGGTAAPGLGDVVVVVHRYA